MPPLDISLFILLIVIVFTSVGVAGFVTFARFLNIEKERARRFRVIHSKPSIDDNDSTSSR